MEQFLFQNMPEAQRQVQLEAVADGAEEKDYSVILTPEEMTERKSKLTNLVIQEARLNDEKAEFVAEINAKLKPVRNEKSAVLAEIKSGSIRETGICYKIVDENEKVTCFYNKRGQLVDHRPMTMDDRQRVIKMAVNQ